MVALFDYYYSMEESATRKMIYGMRGNYLFMLMLLIGNFLKALGDEENGGKFVGYWIQISKARKSNPTPIFKEITASVYRRSSALCEELKDAKNYYGQFVELFFQVFPLENDQEVEQKKCIKEFHQRATKQGEAARKR